MLILKLMLALGILGHALNMYCDRIISIFPHGTLKLANVQKLKEDGYAAKLMEGVSPSVPMRSAVLGVFSIYFEFFGYAALAIYAYAVANAKPFGVIMLLGTLFTCIVSSGYHVKCCLAEYVFLKDGRDERGRKLMLDLMNDGAALRLCYCGLLLYIVTLIAAIVTGAIGFPIWAVVFTILPLFILMFPLQIVGTMHISAMLSMFVWLLLI